MIIPKELHTNTRVINTRYVTTREVTSNLLEKAPRLKIVNTKPNPRAVDREDKQHSRHNKNKHNKVNYVI